MNARRALAKDFVKVVLFALASVSATAVLWWGLATFGADSVPFAFIVVWAPMTWLGSIRGAVQPRLPRSYHALRGWERDGRLYEALGVKVAKRLARRGPIALFNPRLHLPVEGTPAHVAQLEQKMRDAEASHGIALVAATVVAFHAAMRGWWAAAAATVLFNVVLNGYPVMLQRYNRGLLQRRYPSSAPGTSGPVEAPHGASRPSAAWQGQARPLTEARTRR